MPNGDTEPKIQNKETARSITFVSLVKALHGFLDEMGSQLGTCIAKNFGYNKFIAHLQIIICELWT